MKHTVYTILFLIISSLSLVAQTEKKAGYHIEVQIGNYDNDTCILGYHMGPNIYVADTALRNAQGNWVFEGDQPLDGGLYLILVKPSNTYTDFLIASEEDQRDIRLSTKLENGDLQKNLVVNGSADNTLFYDYLNFLNQNRAKDQALARQFEAAKEADKPALQKQLDELGVAVQNYQKRLIKEHPQSLTTSIIQASLQPEVPKGYDRKQGFYYYRDHYWDGFDWSDERLIRTPVFKDKIENWTERLTVQVPDSVIKSVEFIMEQVKQGGNNKMIRYAAAELLNKYAQTKVICMDAVYVFLGEKYYCNGGADWVEQEQLEKICEDVQKLKPLQCGMYAPNIRLRNMEGEHVNLYDVKAEYVALYFWDPSCGNCSKTTDALLPVYEEYKDKGFEIFGICSKTWKDLAECKNKVAEKKMTFVNTSDDAYPLAVVKKQYNVQVNPYLILLDKDKKIRWKRIDANQLRDLLQRGFEQKEAEASTNE